MHRALVRAASLCLMLVLGLLTVASIAAAHPHHLQVENDVDSGENDRIGSNNWIAQSFVAETSFTITRVSLLVRDRSTSDILTASLREDDSGFPATTDLTSGTVNGPNQKTWLDVDFATWIDLSENQTYWVVARSSLLYWWGYEWSDSGDDLAYSDGTGASSPDGASWSYENKDYAFRIYGYHRPSLTYTVTPSETVLEPGDTGQFRMDLNNSGPGDAETLWVNVTLPPELSYVSDDAGSIGGMTNCCYSFEFSNTTPGLHSFNLTFSVNGGVLNGTIATTGFSFESVDHAGFRPATEFEQIPVTIVSGYLDATLSANLPLVNPGDTLQTDLTVENQGDGWAQNVIIEAHLDPNATFLSSTPVGTYDGVGHTVSWSTPVIDPNSSLAFRWFVEVNVDAPDLARVASTVQITYEDSSGTELPAVQTSVQSTVQAPFFTPVLLVDRQTVEMRDEVRATVYYNNTGSVPAPAAWMNWTLAGHFQVVSLNPDMEYTETPQGISLSLTNVATGPHTLVVTLQTVRGMADGLDVSIRVTWEAIDGNGNPLPTTTLPSSIVLNSPDLSIDLEASATRLEVGQILFLNVTMENSGKASATGWLNLTLPDGFEYLGTESGAYDSTVEDGRVSWAITTLAPETDVVLNVRLQLVGDSGLTSLRFTLTFSDGKGSAPETLNSNTVFVEPVAVGTDLGDLALWSLIAAVILLAGILLVRRWIRTTELSVEEVFAVHRDGILMAHRSKTLTPDKDQDVLVAMFKAVQDFVRDAFSAREDAPMRSLAFGEFNILIEQGAHHHLAVVYRGKDNGGLASQLSLLSARIDEEYGEVLQTWSGEMEDVRGIQDLLPMLWGVSPGQTEETPEGDADKVRETVQRTWFRLLHLIVGVRDKLKASPPVEERKIETRADGGWE